MKKQAILTGDAHVDALRGVPREDDLQALAARNSQRAREAVRTLGTRYLLHPANAAKRQPTRCSVLQS